MPVPKVKRSRARRDKRKANKHIVMQELGVCQTCQAPQQSHRACALCGYYKGVKVLRTKADRQDARAMVAQARHGQTATPAE